MNPAGAPGNLTSRAIGERVGSVHHTDRGTPSQGEMEMSLKDSADDPLAIRGADLLVANVRKVLRTELLRERCSASAVARLFAMHRRTLSRHLSGRGLTIRQVANEVRFEIACGLLENTEMALSQIAAVLRYSELSAFSRAFRRWCGQTPTEWRANCPGKFRRSWKLRRPDLDPDPDPPGEHGAQGKVTQSA